jgi:hypothetical protein
LALELVFFSTEAPLFAELTLSIFAAAGILLASKFFLVYSFTDSLFNDPELLWFLSFKDSFLISILTLDFPTELLDFSDFIDFYDFDLVIDIWAATLVSGTFCCFAPLEV